MGRLLPELEEVELAITHISGPCTSCDYYPVKTCDNYKNGTWPECCPNLESNKEMNEATEHIAYLDEKQLQQVKLVYDEWDNKWCLHSQGRRSHVTFEKETVFHYVGRETFLAKFYWLSGRIFVAVNHSAAARNLRGWERSLVESLVDGTKTLVEHVEQSFGVKIHELFWKETRDATLISPDLFDWFEVYHNPAGYETLAAQAAALVLEVQMAMKAKEYLQQSEDLNLTVFGECLNDCIKERQSELRCLLTLKKVKIHTKPDDLPNSLLNAETEICEMKLAAFAKPYEKWLTTEERGKSNGGKEE